MIAMAPTGEPTVPGLYWAKDAQGHQDIVRVLECFDVLVLGSSHKASVTDYVSWVGPLVAPEM